jgi:hypothetical protein
MLVLFISIVFIALCGVTLLFTMFVRDDSRLGMTALGALITADVLAMVYAALDA